MKVLNHDRISKYFQIHTSHDHCTNENINFQNVGLFYYCHFKVYPNHLTYDGYIEYSILKWYIL